MGVRVEPGWPGVLYRAQLVQVLDMPQGVVDGVVWG